MSYVFPEDELEVSDILAAVGSLNFTERDGVIVPQFVFEMNPEAQEDAGAAPEKTTNEDTERQAPIMSSMTEKDGAWQSPQALSSNEGSSQKESDTPPVSPGSPKPRKRHDREHTPLPANFVRSSVPRQGLSSEWRMSGRLSLEHRNQDQKTSKSRAREGSRFTLFLHLNLKLNLILFLFFSSAILFCVPFLTAIQS